MAAEKAPAFQWYPKDCLTDPVVVAMSLEAEGAYRRLIDYCWLKGSLPFDLTALAPLAKARGRAHMLKLWTQMVQKFRETEIEGERRWTHPRLDEERQKQADSRERRQRAADERWRIAHAKQVQSTCNADTLQCSSSSSSSSSSTPVISTPPNPPRRGAIPTKPPTRDERKRAVEIRRAWIRCQHDPSCGNYEACLVAIVLHLRARTATALADQTGEDEIVTEQDLEEARVSRGS